MGKGLATWRGGRGGGQGGGAAHAAEVGLRDLWARVETQLRHVLLCLVGQRVPTSLRLVFLTSNLELWEPVSYRSWESFTGSCFGRTSSVPHTVGAQGVSPSLPSMTVRTTCQFYSVPPESKAVRLEKLWCRLLG